MKKTSIILSIAAAATGMFTACSGDKTAALQQQVDSLSTALQEKTENLDYYQSCLTVLSEGLDSIAQADGSLLAVTGNREGTVDKATVRQQLDDYADLLTRQRSRINELEKSLQGSTGDVANLRKMIALMKQQIEEKDAVISDLQERIQLKDFNISQLNGEVNRLVTVNTNLKDENAQKDEVIGIQNEMINTAYYLIGTSKELKKAGVLSKSVLGGAKVSTEIDESQFTRIDIRNVRQIEVDSKSITVRSSHPKSSYTIDVDKQAKRSILRILDEIEFWKNTRYLIIEK